MPRVCFFGLWPLAFGLTESLQKNATMTAQSKRMPVAASAVLEKFQSNRPVRHIAPLLTSFLSPSSLDGLDGNAIAEVVCPKWLEMHTCARVLDLRPSAEPAPPSGPCSPI